MFNRRIIFCLLLATALVAGIMPSIGADSAKAQCNPQLSAC
jgi:hypothetical protein